MPPTVSDLSVVGSTDASITMSWTEVDDGRNKPASYSIRYMVSPMGDRWGEATEVVEGECASPIQGSQVGATRVCTVTGLASSTSYDFRLTAFREHGKHRVYSEELSNVATGVTLVADTATSDSTDNGGTDSDSTTTSPPPTTVTDLSVAATTENSAELSWTEVDDGEGQAAVYEIRYALTPIGDGWGEALQVETGDCTAPIYGSSIGSTKSCTITGLDAGTGYDFQMVAFREDSDGRVYSESLSNVATATTADDTGDGGTTAASCDAPAAAWIWCDDFDVDRLASYFEYDAHNGDFERVSGVGREGSAGMRARWSRKGQVNAGSLKLAIGRTPQSYFEPVDAGTTDYREVYWRFYVRYEPSWTGGGGDKLSRATAFASSTSWAQAMIAHVWSGSSPDENYLVIDPASGTDEAGNLQTTKYNDFSNLRWLGAARGATPLFDADHVGSWHCVETRVRLNDAGQTNGEFQLWINGTLDAERTGLNWVGDWADYGINAIFLENYWNAGAPQAQERYIDDLVVSTERIGCGGA